MSGVFSSQLSWNTLAIFNRSLGTMLHSGVPIVKAFQVAGSQSMDSTLRRVSKNVVDDIRRGLDVSSAMKEHRDRFPELMIDLIHVAEQTGTLPEVLASLADHYENLLRLRKTFIGQIAWPIFQLIAAILIVAGLIAILGWISSGKPGESIDLLGFGLSGTSGALTWLGLCGATAAGGFALYQLLTKGLLGRSFMHRVLLGIPVVGGCLRSFAIARFSWAFALTQQSGMEIASSINASLKATANGAYIASAPQVVAMIQEGEDLSYALMETGLYPRDFIEMVRVGETTGTVPEQLQRLSPQFEHQARSSLSALSATLAWVIWALVAAMIIFIIFRVMSNYVAMLSNLQKELGI